MMKRVRRGLIIVLVCFLIWQGLVELFTLPEYVLPSPWLVLVAFKQHFSIIMVQAKVTFIEVLLGFIIGIFFGMLTAIIICYCRLAQIWVLPILIVSQALPTFAIAPCIVLWLGYGMFSKVAITVLMIYFPVASTFYDGLRKTPEPYLNVGQIMQASAWRILWHIKVPAAMPRLASGVRMAAVYAPMGAVIGEWVGSSKGLGFLMITANARVQVALMFAALVTLVLMALFLYYGVDYVFNRVITWH